MGEKERSEKLPGAFSERMLHLLGSGAEDFFASYEKGRTGALLLNTSKCSRACFERIAPFEVRPVPWLENGYFFPAECRPSASPLYRAGLYYLQDPGAMTPASRLPLTGGESVLDLCAAPGGKSAAVAARLGSGGCLIANDLSRSRARALLRNLELFGLTQGAVLNDSPAHLTKVFAGSFDRVLLDAPCSGEGMFRKNEDILRDWSAKKVLACAAVSRELIVEAADCLKPGGLLLYSTCTFSLEENEGTVLHLLRERPGMRLLPVRGYEGFSEGVNLPGAGEADLSRCVRIYPHRLEGEGQFLALLQREEGDMPLSEQGKASGKGKKGKREKKSRGERGEDFTLFFDFLSELGLSRKDGGYLLGGRLLREEELERGGERLFWQCGLMKGRSDLPILRSGLFLGELKKNRFEPSVPLALAFRPGEVKKMISLKESDARLGQYLAGEGIPLSGSEAEGKAGWVLLAVEGFGLAFGKVTGTLLKNKLGPGWRER